MSDEKSKATQGSLPTIHASWPGGATNTSPGPKSNSKPSSITRCIRPDSMYPLWCTSQLSVPAMGLTHSDHFQPGSNVALPNTMSPGHEIDVALVERPGLVRGFHALLGCSRHSHPPVRQLYVRTVT